MSQGSGDVDLRSALESIACLASEGPEVYEMEGRPHRELFAEISAVAVAAMAARNPHPAAPVASGGVEVRPMRPVEPQNRQVRDGDQPKASKPAVEVRGVASDQRDRQWMRAIRHLAEHVGAELEADGADIGDAFDVAFGALAMAMAAGADPKRDPSWIVEAVADASKMGTPEETEFKPILTVER